MSGIAGLAYKDRERTPNRELLQKMTSKLAHRGPDGEGFHLQAGIGIGVRQLNITNLETDNQPIYNEDHSVIVVCDGEIYNHIELRRELENRGHQLSNRSSSEVIAHLYEDQGFDCVQRLRGMFAFALWDSRRRILLLARDRLGIKPLYYTEMLGALVFGSEQKALLACPSISREVNLGALQDLMSFGFVVGPKTMFAAISQVPPGCLLTYSQGDTSIRRYWDLPGPSYNKQERRQSVSKWAQILLDKLDEVVRLQVQSRAPVGAWLSGGLDSSAIVGLMRRHVDGPIPVSMLSFDRDDLDEVHSQRTLLDFPDYGLKGRIVTCKMEDLCRLPEALWYFEEPTGSGLEIVRLLIAEASAQDVKVVLSGEGSDEIFGGYPWFLLDKAVHATSILPLPVRRLLAAVPLFPSRYQRLRRLMVDPRPMNLSRYLDTATGFPNHVTEKLLSAETHSELSRIADNVSLLSLPSEFSSWDRFTKLQYYEIHVRLASLVINTIDRGGMSQSLQVRVPFLDHQLVELAARIPPQLKLKRTREKYILREAVKNVLPREIAYRKKRGLRAPVSAWLRVDLPEFANELLSANELRKNGYFDPKLVADLLAKHRANQEDHGYILMRVLAMQLWDRMFRRGNGPIF